MYSFYLDNMLLPIAPETLDITTGNQNEKAVLINDGEINILKKPGLSTIEFEALIPQVNYPFAMYAGDFQSAPYYTNKLRDLKNNMKTFQFIVTRTMPNGKMLFDTNMKVALEEFSVKEGVEEGVDLVVKITLKQYRDYGTKEAVGVSFIQPRPAEPPNGLPTNYKVVSGDCLWTIAKEFYGDGNKWTKIYDANKDEIEDPNLIYPGEVFYIPA